jgi:hypothetical protein
MTKDMVNEILLMWHGHVGCLEGHQFTLPGTRMESNRLLEKGQTLELRYVRTNEEGSPDRGKCRNSREKETSLK